MTLSCSRINGTYYAAAIIMEVLKLRGASSSITKGLVYSVVTADQQPHAVVDQHTYWHSLH